jgi:outer membrane protein assembly factor BamB
MKISRSKTTATAVSLFLLFAMAISLVALPAANAQGTKKTYAFVGATPNPIGVNQQTVIRLGITDQLASALYGWQMTLTITKPDGTTETKSDIRTDATGGTHTLYVPSIAGNYTLQSHFPQQVNPATTGSIPAGTVMLASDSEKITLVVQEQTVPSYPTPPLPTEYWTRPIDNQLREWSPIAGNWLTATNLAATYNRVAVGNDEAPQSAHILWTKPLTSGGLVGGSLNPASEDISNARIEIGDAYEGKFLGSVIMLGKLYYDKYATAEVYHEIGCVDLHTGEEIWSRVLLNNLTLTRGQLLNWKTMDLLGVYDYLWCTGNAGTRSLLGLPSTAGTTWCAFNPFTGDYYYTLYGVPSGNVVYGPNGELLVYTVNLARGYMTVWNSSNIPELTASTEYASMGWSQWRPFQKIVNATDLAGVTLSGAPYTAPSTPFGLNGYQLNVSIPTGLPGSVQSFLDDRIVGLDISTTEVNLWAISLVSGEEGKKLFNETWNAPDDWAAGNVTVLWAATSDKAAGGVLVLNEKETRQEYGFSVETGKYLWVTEPRDYLDFYTMGFGATSARSINQIYDGRFYAGSYAGILYCYNITTGELLWTYTANDPYALSENFDNWPLYPCFIAGGMIYIRHAEHSGYEQALPRGAPFICLNATTGEVIWRADGLFRGTHWGGYPLIGDSIIATMDTYDQRIYAIGKGPSATTVTAPDIGVSLGKSVLVRGTVIDISPGTEEYALTARFPNGVPAVSDENQSDWMLHVYKQFELPADVVGVEVVVSVFDPNNNCYEVGRATSDENGYYSVAFTPPVPGKYTIYATFEGSESYWPSQAETAITVDDLPVETPPPTPTPAPMTDTYVTGFGIGIIIAIVIGFALLLLRKR